MKRKRITLENKKQDEELFNQNQLTVTKEGSEYFFEIGSEMTTDVAEAVSILMRKIEKKFYQQGIKQINLNVSIDSTENISNVMRRLNFYISLKYKVYNITFRKNSIN